MFKIKEELAWVVQAIYDPVDDTCIKCLWVGSLEVCRAASARILTTKTSSSAPTIEFGEGEDHRVLTFPRYGRSRPRRKLNSNYFLEGVVCKEELENVISGHGAELFDQLFVVLKNTCDIPLLREWMPGLFDAGVQTGAIAKLAVVGMDVPVNHRPIYHVKMTERNIKELLLKEFLAYSNIAGSVIKANAA